MPLYPWDEVQKWCHNNNIEYNSMGDLVKRMFQLKKIWN